MDERFRQFLDDLKDDRSRRLIRIDTHEPVDMINILMEVAKEYNMECEVHPLETGDYAYKNIGIERKELDFIKVGDVLTKAEEIKRAYDKAFVMTTVDFDTLVEEDRYRHNSKWNESLKGAVASLVARGVPPIFCPDKRTMCEIMCKMFDKLTDGKERVIEQPLRPQATQKDYQLYVLSSLPHIGTKTAIKLLEQFDTPYAVMNASVEDLTEVDGVGKKIANDIVNVLHGEKEVEK